MYKCIKKYYYNNWERFIESYILLEFLKRENKKINLLDVGFAGGFYILDILDIENIKYTGIDSDSSRISGDGFFTYENIKADWRNNILPNIETIEDDILSIECDRIFDIVISISTIEHIVPMGYANTIFNNYSDIDAINSMKKLLKKDGKLFLSFPCGIEEKYYHPTNKNKTILNNNGFKEGKRDIIYYNKDRIDKLIGDFKVLEKYFFKYPNTNLVTEESALKSVNGYDPKTLCVLILKK